MENATTNLGRKSHRSYHRDLFDDLSDCQLEFIEAIFGKTSDVNIREGLSLYTRQVTRHITTLSATPAMLLLCLLGKDVPSEEGILILSIMMVEEARKLDKNTSVQDISQALIRARSSKETAPFLKENTTTINDLVFASFGWASTLFLTDTDLSGESLRVHQEPPTTSTRSSNPTGRFSNPARKPIGALLVEKSLLPVIPKFSTTTALDIVPESKLLVSNLNYYALSGVGKVAIVWVDSLAEHCYFNKSRRELRLFRFPATTLHAYGRKLNPTPLLSQIVSAEAHRLGCLAQTPEEVTKDFFREVLISYRILFGSSKRSRKLFREKEKKRAGHDGLLDPILVLLAGQKNPTGINDTLSQILEQDVYHLWINLPHLGTKLMEVQDYVKEQRPRNLHAMWHDRRDTHIFHSFWVFALIGSIGIILSFMQVVISLAQLVYAARGSITKSLSLL
ncbi:hypothetical protein BJ875DRAFT_540557 [Amylocarpus encephaloides]|uniref:Uncharacterized protein n=1 Tax=Amylocarpus encephaloides TaxID=45428 RepID=A0A9P8C8I2_9HELO|nr:hypothetical protein BJ875DRAFT_540557 [Amylocarpus encephaloides]